MPADFPAQVDAERRRLGPLFAAASAADSAIHEARDRGVGELGIAAYKQTARYLETLNAFHGTRGTLDRIVERAIADLREGNRDALPRAVAYLDLPGRYFRSGYTRARLYRALRRLRLSDEEKEVLRGVVLRAVPTAGPEFKEIVKLAVLLKSRRFGETIGELTGSAKAFVAKRAHRLLDRVHGGSAPFVRKRP